jgi:cell division septal protein FtsQ
MNLPIRRRTAGRRSRRTRRSSPLIARTRLLAAMGVGLVTMALYLVSVQSVFAVDPARVTINGASYADTEQIHRDLQLPPAGGDTTGERNLFRLTTEEMERRIESLPAVLSANVEVSLPNRLLVRIHERQPVLVWRTVGASWLVDPSGFVIATAVAGQQPDPAALPVIDDRRTHPESLGAGGHLNPLDIEVARLLGGLTPSALGSTATALSLAIDDRDGWTISVPDGWRAIFGPFTSELHTPADIPQQVHCLASLLADRESQVGTITLAVANDRCGTFTDNGAGAGPGGGKPNASGKPNPRPGASSNPAPDRTPRPQSTRSPKGNANASLQPTQKVKSNKAPKAEATPTPRPSR